jgi:AraC-like DNA-binding protein
VPPWDPPIRVGVLSALPAVIRSLGADPAQVLAKAGFDIGLLDDQNKRITFGERSRLIARCAELTNCAHFGLLLGQQGGLHVLGLVGLLVEHSRDVETALRSLVRYFHHHLRGAALDLVVHGGLAVFSYTIYQPGTEGTDQVGDGAIAGAVNIMRQLCGSDWSPNEVMLAHRRPGDVEPYRQFFRTPILFDAEQNAITFPESLLNRQLSEREPVIRRLLKEKIDALEAQFHHDFPEQVRRILRSALLTDKTSLQEIAGLLSLQPRTLDRRLKAYGLSFQDLVDEGRYEIARQALLDTDMNVAHVAALLDYADASSFVRAFRRWCGLTPMQWRRQHQAAKQRLNVRVSKSRAPTKADGA